jgi:hypothetical protein
MVMLFFLTVALARGVPLTFIGAGFGAGAGFGVGAGFGTGVGFGVSLAIASDFSALQTSHVKVFTPSASVVAAFVTLPASHLWFSFTT